MGRRLATATVKELQQIRSVAKLLAAGNSL